MKKKIIIYSYGRNASMNCLFYLSAANNLRIEELEELDQYNDAYFWKINHANNIIVHHHFDWVPSTPNDWTAVHIIRENIFNQAMSTLVAFATDNWTSYENTNVAPTEVSFQSLLAIALDICIWNLKYQEIQSQHDWKNFYVLDFNDCINYTQNLQSVNFENDLHEHAINQHTVIKNPYKHKDIIKNYNELVESWETHVGSQIQTNSYDDLLKKLQNLTNV